MILIFFIIVNGDGMSQDSLDKSEKISKVIARSGICSRRQAEVLVLNGRVSVNGEIINDCAIRVLEKDLVKVDNKELHKEKTRLFIFHKPRGCITSRYDKDGRKLVFDFIPKWCPRLISIGRLDYNSEGLLLMTNDGELSRRLEHPTSGFKRVYRVRAFGDINQQMIDELSKGIQVKGINYKGIGVEIERRQGDNIWLKMTLSEGKNREIRVVLGHYGLEVSRLIRISYGKYKLGDLLPGKIKEVYDKNNFRDL